MWSYVGKGAAEGIRVTVYGATSMATGLLGRDWRFVQCSAFWFLTRDSNRLVGLQQLTADSISGQWPVYICRQPPAVDTDANPGPLRRRRAPRKASCPGHKYLRRIACCNSGQPAYSFCPAGVCCAPAAAAAASRPRTA